MEMVQKMIASSKASYESARAIADSLPYVYTDLMCQVFSDIQSHIGNQLPILINDSAVEIQLSFDYLFCLCSAGEQEALSDH